MSRKKNNNMSKEETQACCICCLIPFLIYALIVAMSLAMSLLKEIVTRYAHFISLIIVIAIALYIWEWKQRKELKKEVEEQKREFERQQRAKGLVKYNDKWGTPQQVERWKEIEIGLSNNFASLTPYQFEEFIAELFRRMDYDAKKTRSTGDFGADVIAKKEDEIVLIEVKRYAAGNNVTPKEVRGTVGALWKYKADKAVFITTSDFTVRAREVEKEAPIELWNKKVLHQMIRKYFIDGVE